MLRFLSDHVLIKQKSCLVGLFGNLNLVDGFFRSQHQQIKGQIKTNVNNIK